MELIPRENSRADLARSLVLTEVFGTPYSEMPLYVFERALAGNNAEYRMAEVANGEHLAGLALYGPVAGTIGTARLYLMAPTQGDAQSRALEAWSLALQALHDDHTRLVVAELPDDRCFDGMRKLLRDAGFREESRVQDLIRDGIDLIFLRRDL